MTATNCQPPARRRSPSDNPWLRIVLLFLPICSDQITKYAARSVLISAQEIPAFAGVVKFSLVENHGGFLGIVSNLPVEVRLVFLNIFVALLLGASLIYLLRFRRDHSPIWAPLALITGGGCSNLLDRLIGGGGVTDFMIVGIGSVQTGIFNLADVFILFGSFVLGFRLFRHSGHPPS